MASMLQLTAGQSAAVEKDQATGTFGQLKAGDNAGATFDDFCGFGQHIVLNLDHSVTPMQAAKVVVFQQRNGVQAVVRLPKGVDSTRGAVSAMTPMFSRGAVTCDDPLRTTPMLSVTTEGLSIVQDKDGNQDFQLKGAN